MDKVKVTERGWAGHFIMANRCRFRRNTLLEYGNTKIVVSSVGLMESRVHDGFETVGHNRYFETMSWYADLNDTRYYDIDVSNPVYFDSPWSINEVDADDKANIMHDKVVRELSEKLFKDCL